MVALKYTLQIAILAVLAIIKIANAEDDIPEFHCGKIWEFTSDSDAQAALEKAISEKQRIGLGCISTLINKNFYGSATYLFDNYYNKRNLYQKAIWEYRDAMKVTRKQLKDLEKLSKRQQTSYVERNPPTQWAQSLDEIQLDIKFSLRHGVPGCINYYDLNITFGSDTFNLTAYCIEGGVKMKYVLNLYLWGTINVDESYYEEQSVGGIRVFMEKDPKPGRWMTLTLDERPENLRLWYEQHKKWHYRLEEFDRDEIYEYEGWDLDSDEDDEEEEAIWDKPIVRKKQLDKKVFIEEAPKPKKKKSKAKKAKKGKKTKKGKKKMVKKDKK